MIILAVLLAGVTAALAVGPPGSRRALGRLAVAPAETVAVRRRRLPPELIIAVVIMLGLPSIAGVFGGWRGFWLGVPVMILVGTTLLIVRRALRRRQAAINSRQVAQACSVLAAQVKIGRPPLVALRSAAEDCSVLRPAVDTADLGGDLPDRWATQAREPGRQGLSELARAWQLSSVTGSPMAGALDDVSEALIADESLELVIGSEAAGPRASGKVMAALPLVGVALGYLIGGDPLDFLVNSAAGWGCLVGGSVLVSAGVLWMERVADQASVGR